MNTRTPIKLFIIVTCLLLAGCQSTAATPVPATEILGTPTPAASPTPTKDPEIEAEYQALAALYQATNGERWTDDTNWLSEKPFCSWHGVRCSQGHVTALDLNTNRLQGELPPEFGQLTYLETLNLSGSFWDCEAGNQITRLPPEIGQLTSLQILDLSFSQLMELPPEIGRLSNLQELYLYGNQITEIPPEIGQLGNLQKLDLWDNLFTELPPEIGRLSNLRELYLGKEDWVDFSPSHITKLPPEIGQLANLRVLNLEDIHLTELPPEIGRLANLQELNLFFNQLTELPPEFGHLTNLRDLDLGSNALVELPPEFGQLTNLQTLDLAGNQLTELPPEFGQLSNLQKLDLYENPLTKLPPELGLLTNLKSLDLSNNPITELPPEICQNISIEPAALCINSTAQFPLTGQGPWLLFLAKETTSDPFCSTPRPHYLWVMDQDGTWWKKLERAPVSAFAIRPGSTISGGAVVAYRSGSTLKLMELPSGSVTTVTESAQGSLKWSPGGSLLAFIGTSDDGAEVYTYDYTSGAITPLSEHPGTASDPRWSPTGERLIYEAQGDIWSVKSDGADALLLADNPEDTKTLYIYGWFNEAQIILLEEDTALHQYKNIQIVSIDTGASTTVVEEPFIDAAYSKEHNIWLLAQPRRSESDTPLIVYKDGQRTEILIPGQRIEYLWWAADRDLFFGGAQDNVVYAITPNGETNRLAKPSVTPLCEDCTATAYRHPRWAGRLQLTVTESHDTGVEAIWSPQFEDAFSRDSIRTPDGQYHIVLGVNGLYKSKLPDTLIGMPLIPFLCNNASAFASWSPWQAAWIQ
ncbi:MAG: leucine-rich repeat domain-containing protein [Anaerolineae bacterium]|nr:leucine-rich repeat domain-containing protein [Anaerolineae bacterium]